MKKFITKREYLANQHEGVSFMAVSATHRKQICTNLEHLHRQIVENSRNAADQAAKVILNR